MKSREFFNNAIKSILKLGEMHSFKFQEYLVAPSNVAKARNLPVSERMLYNNQCLQNVILVITMTPIMWILNKLWELMIPFFALLVQ